MKRSHLIAIIIIALAVGAIIATISDSGTYADFSDAFANEGKEFHVVGRLAKDKEMIYDPLSDPNLFIFTMADDKGTEKKIFLHKAKPQEFELSEQIVVIGKGVSGEFHAREILMKCPSKYTDNQVRAE
ncbi:MAG: cytochrome c maturation protein CcmE [Bacteroidetes bacterium]|nr:cytochrome c maturation protein CcmE [Bacteroidota bacterium]